MLRLGVGAATAMFGIVDSVLLRPLPYPDSHRIVTLAEVGDDGRRQDSELDAAEFPSALLSQAGATIARSLRRQALELERERAAQIVTLSTAVGAID
jgi:hypothetical protein